MTVTIKDTPPKTTTKKPEVGKAYRGVETGHLYLCVHDPLLVGNVGMTSLTRKRACSVVGEYIEVDLEIIVK